LTHAGPIFIKAGNSFVMMCHSCCPLWLSLPVV